MNIYRRQVERGAARLDDRRPGWWKLVTQPINLDSDSKCVLGQVYGNYGVGCSYQGLDILTGSRHGFLPSTRFFLYCVPLWIIGITGPSTRVQRRYEDEWKRAIAIRRVADLERQRQVMDAAVEHALMRPRPIAQVIPIHQSHVKPQKERHLELV